MASSKSKASASADTYNFEDVDFDKFSAFMSNKFGKQAFQMGWEIMQKYKGSRFTSDAEMPGYLWGVLATEKEAAEFVSLCSTYMILENYAKNLASKR